MKIPLSHSKSAAILALGIALLTGFAAPQASAQVTSPNIMGFNLWFHRDFNNTFAFTDLVKRSRPWGSAARPFEPIANVDALGWPKQDAGLFLHVSSTDNAAGDIIPGPAPLPTGRYKIIFTGRATTIQPSTGSIANPRYDSATNTTRADWRLAAPAHDNVTISFLGTRRTATAALNTGLTNLRIYLPGFPDDGSVTFTPAFKAVMRKFHIIRYMDWIEANLNPLQNFSERTLPTHATQARVVSITDRPDLDFRQATSGVALEYMVQLCNETATDMWLNIPARATDSAIRGLLRVVRDGNPALGFRGLDPARKLYVEFANEIWNTSPGFLGFSRVKAQADAARANPAHPINFDGNTDEFTAFFRFIAFRARSVSELCRLEFGDAAMMTRVRPILASQFGDGQATFSTGLRFLHEFYSVARPNNTVPRRVNQILFGGGGAPYALGDVSSPDAYFQTIPQADFLPSIRRDAVLARGYGIRCVAYEGGPAIADPVTGIAALDGVTSRDFNADTRMRDTMLRLQNLWSAGGGDIFIYYVATGDPAFEFTAKDSAINSPKLLGITDLRARNKANAATGALVPATFFSTSTPHLINEGNFLNTTAKTAAIRAETFMGKGQLFLPFRTADNLPVQVVLKLETAGGPSGGSCDVFINGMRTGLRVSLAANTPFTFRTQSTFTTQRGLNVLRFTGVTGEIQLRRVTIELPPAP